MNRLQPVHQSFGDAEEQRIAVVQAAGNERLDYSHLQTTTGQPAAAGAAGSSRFDRRIDRSDVSRQRQLAVDDDAKVTSCVLHFYA